MVKSTPEGDVFYMGFIVHGRTETKIMVESTTEIWMF